MGPRSGIIIGKPTSHPATQPASQPSAYLETWNISAVTLKCLQTKTNSNRRWPQYIYIKYPSKYWNFFLYDFNNCLPSHPPPPNGAQPAAHPPCRQQPTSRDATLRGRSRRWGTTERPPTKYPQPCHPPSQRHPGPCAIEDWPLLIAVLTLMHP